MLSKNIKANLFKSKSTFMDLLKPTGVTTCSGENLSSIQRNLISSPVPTISGCPDWGDTAHQQCPSPPRCWRCSPGREGTHTASHRQEGRLKQSVYTRWLLLIHFQATLTIPWDRMQSTQPWAVLLRESYISFNSSSPTFSSPNESHGSLLPPAQNFPIILSFLIKLKNVWWIPRIMKHKRNRSNKAFYII